MTNWRFYNYRAKSKTWLDNNVALSDPAMTFSLSAPHALKAKAPGSLFTAKAQDGLPYWKPWSNLLFAEEGIELQAVYILMNRTPNGSSLDLEFAGFSTWLNKVPFEGTINVWQSEVFGIVRQILADANRQPVRLTIISGTNKSTLTVGDPQPPTKPKEPGRKKGETVSKYHSSDRYKQWQKDLQAWNEKYQSYAQYALNWWEGPMIGAEIDRLAKEVGFEYREDVRWLDRAAQTFELKFTIADELVQRRTDIALVENMNLAARLAPAYNGDDYANRVITLGSGEGKGMIKGTATDTDSDTLTCTTIVDYKTIKSASRLDALAEAERKTRQDLLGLTKVSAWDVPGFAPLRTLRPGHEVLIKSASQTDPISVWRRISQIERTADSIQVNLTLV